MKLLQVELNNFRNEKYKCIDFINELGEVRQFTVLIGDNGTGKTSILEAITKGYTPIVRTISSTAVEKCDLTDSDIKNGEKWTAIKITSRIDERDYCWYNRRRMKKEIDYAPQVQQDLDIKGIKSAYSDAYENGRVPLVLYYGTDRIIRDVPKRGHIKEFTAKDALKNCFDNANYFRDFYEWFKTEEDIELREKADNPNYQSIQLNSVRSAIESMIPGYKNLRIKLNPARMIITDQSQSELVIDQLSGGYKAILSMVSDIAQRLSLANPETTNPLQEQAIILIDEIDLHLHPKWQKRIAADLKRTFPNCQFIVTTHSPFIIQSLDKEELINLERDIQEIAGSFEGWSIEEIQEYEMGVQRKTEYYLDRMRCFSDAIDNEEFEAAKKLYEELLTMIHPKSIERKILDMDMVGIE